MADLPQTSQTLSIAGNLITSFHSFELKQKMQGLHQMCLVVDQELIGLLGSNDSRDYKNWIGEFWYLEYPDHPELSYTGVVTGITQLHGKGNHSELCVTGNCQTVLLNSTAHTRSWEEVDLQAIVSEVLLDTPFAIEAEISPTYTDTITYECQYEEGNFDFLSRLSQQYSQYFYYDGRKIVFGARPESQDYSLLEYPTNLSSIHLEQQTNVSSVSPFSYDIVHNQLSNYPSGETISVSENVDLTLENSSDLFPEVLPNLSRLANSNSDSVSVSSSDSVVQRLSDLDKLSCQVKGDQLLFLNKTIAVDSYKDNEVVDGSVDYEYHQFPMYHIVVLDHRIDAKGKFSSCVIALPNALDVLPINKGIVYPKVRDQYAYVIDNVDPENLGRVRVCLDFHVGDANSYWIPVGQFEAGSSEDMERNRGFCFIPEINDRVIVGFINDNPNAMYVKGCSFTGDTAYTVDTENHVKHIATDFGYQIVFDDNPDNEHIAITDKDQNKIVLDTAEEYLQLLADEFIGFGCSDFMVDTQEGKFRSVSEHVLVDVQDGFQGKASAFHLASQKKHTVDSRSEAKESIDQSGVVLSNEELSYSSELQLKVQGSSKADIGGTQLTLAGASMDLGSGGGGSVGGGSAVESSGLAVELYDSLYNEYEAQQTEAEVLEDQVGEDQELEEQEVFKGGDPIPITLSI